MPSIAPKVQFGANTLHLDLANAEQQTGRQPQVGARLSTFAFQYPALADRLAQGPDRNLKTIIHVTPQGDYASFERMVPGMNATAPLGPNVTPAEAESFDEFLHRAVETGLSLP